MCTRGKVLRHAVHSVHSVEKNKGNPSMKDVANAIREVFISPNVADSNLEPANVVDTIQQVASGLYAVRNSIAPNVAGGTDAAGGHVTSLTEACMGITAGLMAIASALESVAAAIDAREEHE